MSTASKSYYSLKLSQARSAKYTKILRIVLFIGILVVIFASVYSKFQSFIQAGGFWAFFCSLAVTYPPLTYLVFTNDLTPQLTIQMYYYCLNQQSGEPVCSTCNTGDYFDCMVFNTSSSTPWVTTGQGNQTVMQIVESNSSSDIGSWNDLMANSTFLYNFPQFKSVTPPPPPSSPSASTIFSYVMPVIMLAAMFLMKI